ncbi:phosphoenolpyruvate--protein phosphotransferase [Verrucomicrobium sp. GAS474]|uniref:phosphoenolpyruvate--protein phosphotransferase n=1 Tax=Verrucomicrobium sp. GAS474 TaxID=1882831 RepID=UPI0012FFC6E0|nr:phosphoenolpyruvate--protein phosphotransferase [Verrucomicrobium sp. GAS474]
MQRETNKVATETRFQGIPGSPGIATGPVLLLRQNRPNIRRRPITADKIPAELERLEVALLRTRQQILEAQERLATSVGKAEAAIFEAHLLVVEDPTILQGVKAKLAEKLISVEAVYQDITSSLADQMLALEDDYLRERAEDIHDVSRRVLQNLRAPGEAGVEISQPCIVVADALSLTDLMATDRSALLGFATEQGNRMSHAAIIARSLNIPAVVGLRDVVDQIENGMEVLLDGITGLLILLPNEQTKFEYGQMEERRHRVEEQLDTLRDTLAATRDGHRVIISANVELPEDFPHVAESGAEGIGLYRTEFLFINRNDLPGEEEQCEVYRKAAQTAKPHSIIIRTLDVGGDKAAVLITGDEPEANPFLGWRGIRLCLDRLDVFKTQLRAIARASVEGNVRVMFPMVSDIAEIRRSKALFLEALAEIRAEGVPVPEKVEIGVMIEVPSAALTADILAKEVDFFSIGTNDLVQYTMAVDRLNERVASLYQPCHPAVLRLIARVAEEAHKNGIWAGICGEMASDVLLTPLLIGLGIDELSMGSVSVPRVKKAIQSVNREECAEIARTYLAASTHDEIVKGLAEFAKKTYPDLII